MKNNKHVESFGQFNENLNISDVSESLSNEMKRIIQRNVNSHKKAMDKFIELYGEENVDAAKCGMSELIVNVAETFIKDGECTLNDWLVAFKDYDYVVDKLIQSNSH